jgi:hypothetical protein
MYLGLDLLFFLMHFMLQYLSDIGEKMDEVNVYLNFHIPQTLTIHHSSLGFFPTSSCAQLPDASSSEFDPLTFVNTFTARSLKYNPCGCRTHKRNISPDYIAVQCGVDAQLLPYETGLRSKGRVV